MNKIVQKEKLTESITKLVVNNHMVANNAKAGQFIILRIDEYGERIPLTIFDVDKTAGNVSIVYQTVGKSTMLLDKLNVGDNILNFVGPLGKPSEFVKRKNVLIIAGGVGCAAIYLQAKELKMLGNSVEVILGFRSLKDVIFEEELMSVSDKLTIVTNDGSYGEKGLVTDALLKKVKDGNKYNLVICVGPLLMMKAVCQLTKKFSIKTVVSMNPIMIDGTGMCGGCRLTVDGKTKFACVDGPEFDGHKIDFDMVIMRNSTYKIQEQESIRHKDCRLMGGSYV